MQNLQTKTAINSSKRENWGLGLKSINGLRSIWRNKVLDILIGKKRWIEHIEINQVPNEVVSWAQVITKNWVNRVLVDWIVLRDNKGYIREFWEIEHIEL
jgi:hypothetical protein